MQGSLGIENACFFVGSIRGLLRSSFGLKGLGLRG